MNIHSFINNRLTLSSQNRFKIETPGNLFINIVEWGKLWPYFSGQVT